MDFMLTSLKFSNLNHLLTVHFFNVYFIDFSTLYFHHKYQSMCMHLSSFVSFDTKTIGFDIKWKVKFLYYYSN